MLISDLPTQNNMCNPATKTRVVQLYKQLIYLGRQYPKDPEVMTAKIHNVFMKNSGETDTDKIEDLINKGNYIVKELEALYYLKKYRTLKQRYYDTPESKILTPHLDKALQEDMPS